MKALLKCDKTEFIKDWKLTENLVGWVDYLINLAACMRSPPRQPKPPIRRKPILKTFLYIKAIYSWWGNGRIFAKKIFKVQLFKSSVNNLWHLILIDELKIVWKILCGWQTHAYFLSLFLFSFCLSVLLSFPLSLYLPLFQTPLHQDYMPIKKGHQYLT